MIDWETRRRIEDFLLDCAWAIDENDLEAWPDFFAADGRYRITTRDNEERGLPVGIMLCEGRGMMEDRVLALRTANIFEPHRYRHILGRPRLREAEGRLVRSDSSFIVMRTMQDGRMDLFAAGNYRDLLRVEDGRVMFQERAAVLESRRVDVLIVIPI